jgi:ketopantoate reductase
MQIAVLGTGSVGRTSAGRLAELGHDVLPLWVRLMSALGKQTFPFKVAR